VRKGLFLPDDRLQRDLWALALLLLAILLALSFVPLTLLGDLGVRLFPTGNVVGRVGALLSSYPTRAIRRPRTSPPPRS
jgi:energy-converting hydrogenase Eha subunit A